MLRRFKDQESKSGKKLLDIPKKHIHLIRLNFSGAEQDFYKSLYEQSKTQFDTFVNKGTVLTHYTAVVALITKLRQACCHPYLVLNSKAKKPNIAETVRQLVESNGITADEALYGSSIEPIDIRRNYRPSTKIRALLHYLKVYRDEDKQKGTNTKSVVFSQWTGFMDLIEVALEKAGINFARLDGSQTLTKRSKSIEQFERDKSTRMI